MSNVLIKICLSFLYGLMNVGLTIGLVVVTKLDINGPMRGQLLKMLMIIMIVGVCNCLMNKE